MIAASFPYPTRRLRVLGSGMACVEVGRGGPIVLLHGNPRRGEPAVALPTKPRSG